MNGGSETREPGGDEWRGMLAVQDGPPRLIPSRTALAPSSSGPIISRLERRRTP